MNIVDRWLLPDGIKEVLPLEAEKLETTRRRLLDTFQHWGYALVFPPMIEFLESLLTGTGTDLDLKTFKLTDQVSGRMMGIRADMTPQVARIDAHSLNRDSETRLCYAGTLLHAKADNMLASRSPISIGAELFGSHSASADLEIISLMIASITEITGENLHLELGDVDIFRQLVAATDMGPEQEDTLFDMIQRKALPDLEKTVRGLGLADDIARLMLQLPVLCGGKDTLHRARALFGDYPTIQARLRQLELVADSLVLRFPEIALYFDLSELRGYNYHTGIVFATYLPKVGCRVAKGGRYDDVGAVFGRARAATGFDIDLQGLCTALAAIDTHVKPTVQASPSTNIGANDKSKWLKICQLRASGYIVIETADVSCDHKLIARDGDWVLQ